ncbi:MAG: MFS transporter [Spirochaetales bacterium]|nr:MFS transporter [Spirochaetales bacterium]
MERFKGSRLFLYNFSTAGHALFDTMLLFYAAKFFLPTAENIEQGMIQFVPELILGVIPILGLLMVFGRIVDALADPLIASWSDRSTSKFGRRRFFLIFGGAPLAISTALVFFPPFAFTTMLNVIYVALIFGLYFIFYTMYVAPYIALIPELGHSEKERLNMTTAQGYFALVGAGLVMIGGPVLYSMFLKDSSPVGAFQLMIVILSAIGAVLLYLAVISVNEKKYSDAKPCAVPFWESLKKTLKNRPFIIFLITNMCFWFMFNTIRASVNHIGQTLMVVNEASIGYASIIIFVGAAVFFPLVLFLSGRIGKKTVMIIGLGVFAFLSVLISFTGIGTNPDGLTCNYVTSIASPDRQTTWVGTAHGISSFDGKVWNYYDKDAGLTDNSVTSIASMSDGSLWVGTKNGISIYKSGSWSARSEEDGLVDNHVTALTVDNEGTLWCGTKNGISRYHNGVWSSITESNGLVSNAVTSLACQADGTLWIGTEQGLSRFDGSIWHSFTEQDGLSDNHITALAIAADGSVWCGTKNGLMMYDGGSWKTYTKQDGLTNNYITCLSIDKEGTIWIGTKSGVTFFDNTRFYPLTVAPALQSSHITWISIPENDKLWAGTMSGLSYIQAGNVQDYSNTGPFIWALIIFALFGFSVAALLIIPNVFISDLCDYDTRKTGERREGMYFGVHGFFMKLNLGVSFALMSFFYSVFGKDIANPLGVRLACIIVSVVGILGIIVFLKYPDKLVKNSSPKKK